MSFLSLSPLLSLSNFSPVEMFIYIVILLARYMLVENLMQILGSNTFVVGSSYQEFDHVISTNLKHVAHL